MRCCRYKLSLPAGGAASAGRPVEGAEPPFNGIWLGVSEGATSAGTGVPVVGPLGAMVVVGAGTPQLEQPLLTPPE